jgi:hypothetical protein
MRYSIRRSLCNNLLRLFGRTGADSLLKELPSWQVLKYKWAVGPPPLADVITPTGRFWARKHATATSVVPRVYNTDPSGKTWRVLCVVWFSNRFHCV